jgi:hypothetical protein
MANENAKTMIYHAIKQQYFNADTVGINQTNRNSSKCHQPILISKLMQSLKAHTSQSKQSGALASSSSQIDEQQTPYSNILDGFYLLEKSRIDIPDSISSVDVSGNNLGSVVEDDLQYFTSLLFLDASDNQVPLSPFASLPKLQELRLTCNNITTISIEEINSGFSYLAVLDLSYNSLTVESIQSLHVLPGLRQLDLSGNGLTSLPSEMFQFKDLDKLILTHNQFTDDKIFIILSYVPKLRHINLAYNYLSEFLSEASDNDDQFK